MIHMRSRREELCGIVLDRRDPTVRDRNSGQLAVRQLRPFEESVDLHERCLATQCCNSPATRSRGRSGCAGGGGCGQPALGNLPCTPSTSQFMPLSSASGITAFAATFCTPFWSLIGPLNGLSLPSTIAISAAFISATTFCGRSGVFVVILTKPPGPRP